MPFTPVQLQIAVTGLVNATIALEGTAADVF